MSDTQAFATADVQLRHTRGWLGGVMCVEHACVESSSQRGSAVMVFGALGYEDTSAYRPLRVMADALAAQGHRVVRLTWPGLGDSAGDSESPDVFELCVEGARGVAAALRQAGATRLLGVALRAGGLLALKVEELDELVLWGTPGSGKRFLREQRAFHSVAARSFGDPPPDRALLAEGAVEAGGFVFGPDLVRGLEGIDVAACVAEMAPDRVLVLPADGTRAPKALLAAFEAAGSALSVVEVSGLPEVLENAYHARLSESVARSILDFTAEPKVPGAIDALALEAERSLPCGGHERLWLETGGAGALVGVVCEPAGGAGPDTPWTVFFNAGGIRRSGPSRLWTRAARRMAALGVASLRFDVRDVGDSDGASVPHADLEAMYAEGSVADALLAVDALVELGAASVDLVGLCSGAFMSVQVASRRNIRRATVFNGLAFVWDDDARASSMTAHIGASMLDARRWRRLLTGRIDRRALVRSVVQKGRLRGAAAVRRLRGEAGLDPVEEVLGEVLRRGTELRLYSSEGDPSIAYLEAKVQAIRRPSLTVLPGMDHTLRPAWCHDGILGLITDGLDGSRRRRSA